MTNQPHHPSAEWRQMLSVGPGGKRVAMKDHKGEETTVIESETNTSVKAQRANVLMRVLNSRLFYFLVGD